MTNALPSFYNRSHLRIGLLGGSFNPPHEGHLYISLLALKQLRLHAVWWLVSPQNPLKSTKDTAPLAVRIAWSKVLAKHPSIHVTDLESYLGTRYSYDTVRKLKTRHPTYRFIFLMGSDNLIQLPRWYKWKELLQEVVVSVYNRGPNSYKALAGKMAITYKKHRLTGKQLPILALSRPPAWGFMPVRTHPASSTQLRQTLKNHDRYPYDEHH